MLINDLRFQKEWEYANYNRRQINLFQSHSIISIYIARYQSINPSVPQSFKLQQLKKGHLSASLSIQYIIVKLFY